MPTIIETAMREKSSIVPGPKRGDATGCKRFRPMGSSLLSFLLNGSVGRTGRPDTAECEQGAYCSLELLVVPRTWLRPAKGEAFLYAIIILDFIKEMERKQSMKEQLEHIAQSAMEALQKVQNSAELEQLKVKVLGRKGELTQQMRLLGKMSPEERPAFGQMVNAVREKLTAAMEKMEADLKEKENAIRFAKEAVDVTAPGTQLPRGSHHPLSLVLQDIRDTFLEMGFSISEGPEIELDHYNFELLNIPQDHPARDEQDTFYITSDIVLRTQTSPVQARVMEQGKLPIRMLSPGRVYRSDEVDATHSPSFHQIEGLVVDKGITFADLKGTLAEFAKELFGPETKTKFRPHHFPFTEPSAEMDVTCFKCGGTGCRFCKGSGWIEILGCGMVHPHVFEMCGIDPEEYTGFAFGVGLERIALLKYEIDDMRLLYENDIRFLKQF